MLSYMDMIRECVVPREQLRKETRAYYIIGYNDGYNNAINQVIGTLLEDYALPQEVIDKLNNLKK